MNLCARLSFIHYYLNHYCQSGYELSICRISIVFHFPSRAALSRAARQSHRGRHARHTSARVAFRLFPDIFPRRLSLPHLPHTLATPRLPRHIGKCHPDTNPTVCIINNQCSDRDNLIELMIT